MTNTPTQMSFFESISLNCTYEIKRQLRMALSGSTFSRDEVADEINKIAVREGMRKQISKQTLDNWMKNSDSDRLPSLPWLTIFCSVLNTVGPIAAMIRPLGADIIDETDARLLAWARAEREKRRANKKAKLAEQALEEF